MDSVAMERFFASFDEKRGKRGIATIAQEIGVSQQALKDLMEGNVSAGFLTPNAKAIGAFFKTCEWLGVEARTFLVEEG